MMSLLKISDLSVSFKTERGQLQAVDHLSFDLMAGETLAIVGESGSGKSVSLLSMIGLLNTSYAAVAGRVEFQGQDLLALSERELARIRGNRISLIFQEPMTALNPVLTVGQQIKESIRLHQQISSHAAAKQALQLLEQVGIQDPVRRIREYPHQLSGGMRQRVMIAMALACRPEVLLADEPTTALDVTVQAQILELLADLQKQSGTAIVLITHDLGVVAEVAQRVIIMYAGRKVEEADCKDLLLRPSHPYTRGLLAAVPQPRSSKSAQVRGRLHEIPGMVLDLTLPVDGCAFAARCTQATDLCRSQAPALKQVGNRHVVACHYIQEPESV